MNLFENLQLMKESDISHIKVTNVKNKLTLESTNNLWNKFVNIYNGFVPINDLSHYFSLDKFGEFVQWCRKEADLDYDYGKRYDNWDEVFKDLDEATGVAESISLENIFNFFTTDDLTGFWDWVVKEYDLDDELKESKHLKEYNSNINNKDQLYNEMLRYTEEPLVSFNDLFNCYSTDDLQDLYDYLSSEYEDDEFPVYRGKINNKDEMWRAMNELILPNEQQIGFDDLFNCYSLDKLKELYDYLSSEYSDVDEYDEEEMNESYNNESKLNFSDWLDKHFDELVKDYAELYDMNEIDVSYEDEDFEEYANDQYERYYRNMNHHLYKDYKEKMNESLSSVQVNEKIEYIKDALDALKSFANKEVYIPSDIADSLNQIYSLADTIYEYTETMTEATSGIGGAYTTKSIDIVPGAYKKPKLKEIKTESLVDNCISKIDKENSKVELVKLLHKIRANKGLTSDEVKQLEDKIKNKVKNIKQ